MKVLLNHFWPFNLAHGGTQIQIEQTKQALEKAGVEVEWLEWWNDRQRGDILHHFGALSTPLIELAHAKRLKIAATLLLTDTCNRPWFSLFIRAVPIRLAMLLLPSGLKRQLPWHAYRLLDKAIVGLNAEKLVLQHVYGLAERAISIVPLGLSERFLAAGPPLRSDQHLVCVGTISPAKRSLELATLASQAQVPIRFVGKPFDFESDYWKQFERLIDGKVVQHHPHVGSEADLIELLRRARGYVLMSRSENWSLAAHEAAACGLPMLIPNQRWARERFGGRAHFFPRGGNARIASALRAFYEAAPTLPSPDIRLFSWDEVGNLLKSVYAEMLA